MIFGVNFEKLALGVDPRGLRAETKSLVLACPIQRQLKILNWSYG